MKRYLVALCLIALCVSGVSAETSILLKRGVSSRLPTSAPLGEPLYTTDTHNVYIGNGAGVMPSKVTGVTAEVQTAIDDKVNRSELGTAAAKNAPVTGNASTVQVVMGSDTRLTNPRTPNAHNFTHAAGGTDAIAPADIGLGNVNDTADADKPVSTATQFALDGKHNINDFGILVSPSGGDDTAAIQNAVTAATAGARKVIFKSGTYLISAPVMVPSSQITLSGESFAIYGNSGVVIKATAPMVAMFRFGDTGTSRASTYENLYLDGNYMAQHGFLVGSSDGLTFYTAAYMQWTNVEIVKTTKSAWTVGGWNNVWRRCYTNVNSGNGIVMTGTQNNACEINSSDLDANDGWGLVYYGGTGLAISGKSSIQMNKKGGVYLVGSATGVSIDAYFEKNAQTGYTLTSPSKTVKTDILINSAAAGGELSAANTNLNFGVNIVGSTFIDNYADNPLTMIGKVRTLRFVGNTGSAAYARSAIAFELDSSYHETRSLEYKGNINFTAPFSVTGITGQSAALVAGASSQINIPMWRNWLIEDLPGLTSGNAPFYSVGVPRNIFPSTITGLTPLGIQASLKGTVAQAAKPQWPNPKTPAFELTLDNTTSSDVFGASYRSSDYIGWVGKPVFFSADIRGEDDTAVQGALYWRVVWDAWAANTSYSVGQRAFVGSNLYEVTTAGTSAASGGPSGTGSSIADGTAVWQYIAANATSTGQDVSGGTLSLTQWQAREVRFVWPNSGATVYVGVRAAAGGSTGKRILFTRPVLAPIGLPSQYYWNGAAMPEDIGASAKVAVPVSAAEPGLPGQWAADTSYTYFYTGDGTTHAWRRVAIGAW